MRLGKRKIPQETGHLDDSGPASGAGAPHRFLGGIHAARYLSCVSACSSASSMSKLA
jgi:hypothetical protein